MVNWAQRAETLHSPKHFLLTTKRKNDARPIQFNFYLNIDLSTSSLAASSAACLKPACSPIAALTQRGGDLRPCRSGPSTSEQTYPAKPQLHKHGRSNRFEKQERRVRTPDLTISSPAVAVDAAAAAAAAAASPGGERVGAAGEGKGL